MKRMILRALCIVALSAHVAMAMDLDTAKARGLVGETRTGYLAAVVTTSPEANAVVEDINAKRRAEYARIAAANNQDIRVIEKLAAQKAYEMTPSGQYLKDAGGNWVKK